MNVWMFLSLFTHGMNISTPVTCSKVVRQDTLAFTLGSKISQSVSNASHVNTRHQISKGGSSPLKKHEKVFKIFKRLQNNTFTF